MNMRQHLGVLHPFSMKDIFLDKMDVTLFYFHCTEEEKFSFRNLSLVAITCRWVLR